MKKNTYNIYVYVMQLDVKRKFGSYTIKALTKQEAIERLRKDYFFPFEVCEFKFV